MDFKIAFARQGPTFSFHVNEISSIMSLRLVDRGGVGKVGSSVRDDDFGLGYWEQSTGSQM